MITVQIKKLFFTFFSYEEIEHSFCNVKFNVKQSLRKH